MTREQLLRARSVIEGARRLGRHRYLVPERNEYCALGLLAHDAGVPDRVLVAAGQRSIDQGDEAVVVIREAIKTAFGLNTLAQVDLQDVNDKAQELAARRSYVLAHLELQAACLAPNGWPS